MEEIRFLLVLPEWQVFMENSLKLCCLLGLYGELRMYPPAL